MSQIDTKFNSIIHIHAFQALIFYYSNMHAHLDFISISKDASGAYSHKAQQNQACMHDQTSIFT